MKYPEPKHARIYLSLLVRGCKRILLMKLLLPEHITKSAGWAVVPTILTTLALCPSRIHLDAAEKVWGLNLGFYKEILPSGGHLPTLFKISMKKKKKF